LFYDLVVAVALTQVAMPLSGVLSRTVSSLFFGLFPLVWWVWTGHTVYTTRFETDDTLYVLLAFAQMLAVVGIGSLSLRSVSGTPVALGSHISPAALSSLSSSRGRGTMSLRRGN
jgi:low temperature requirement protein LtrA